MNKDGRKEKKKKGEGKTEKGRGAVVGSQLTTKSRAHRGHTFKPYSARSVELVYLCVCVFGFVHPRFWFPSESLFLGLNSLYTH